MPLEIPATSQGDVCETTVHYCLAELLATEAVFGPKGLASIDLARFLSRARRGESLGHWSLAQRRMHAADLDKLGVRFPATARDD